MSQTITLIDALGGIDRVDLMIPSATRDTMIRANVIDLAREVFLSLMTYTGPAHNTAETSGHGWCQRRRGRVKGRVGDLFASFICHEIYSRA